VEVLERYDLQSADCKKEHQHQCYSPHAIKK
jgi:hypothetical protein